MFLVSSSSSLVVLLIVPVDWGTCKHVSRNGGLLVGMEKDMLLRNNLANADARRGDTLLVSKPCVTTAHTSISINNGSNLITRIFVCFVCCVVFCCVGLVELGARSESKESKESNQMNDSDE